MGSQGLRPVLGLILGPLLILLGLAWPGWVKLPVPQIAVRARRATSIWGAGALGAAFAVAVCPICTPTLVVLLGVAAGAGSTTFGVLLLLAFAVGRAVPILLGGCGLALILSGLYMLNAFFLVIPELAV